MLKNSKDKQIKKSEDKSGGKEKRFYPTLGATLTEEEAEKKLKDKDK